MTINGRKPVQDCTCGSVSLNDCLVHYTRHTNKGRLTVRRRICSQCGRRFSTIELPAMRTPDGWVFATPGLKSAKFFLSLARQYDRMAARFRGLAVSKSKKELVGMVPPEVDDQP